MDNEKIHHRVDRQPNDTGPDWERSWYDPIINNIPRGAYLEVGVGVEQDGESVMVVVLDKGYHREALAKEPVHTDDGFFAQLAECLLTPGI